MLLESVVFDPVGIALKLRVKLPEWCVDEYLTVVLEELPALILIFLSELGPIHEHEGELDFIH